MARSKKVVLTDVDLQEKPEQQTTIPGVEAAKPFEPYRPAEDAPKLKQRFSFTLTDDGKPDLGSMRDSTRTQFAAFVRDEGLKTSLGVTEAPPPPIITEHDIRILYTALGPIEAYAAALAMKVPIALASRVFTYTDDDLEKLVPPTTALMNKYAPYFAKYLQWKEEIAFGMAFFGVTRQKLTMLRELANQQRMTQEPNPATEDAIKTSTNRIVEETPIEIPGAIVSEGFATTQANV